MDIVLAALCGFLMDLALGDPAWMPHPVVGMGKCIAALERGLRRAFPKTPRGELAAGAVLAALLPLGTLGLAAGALWLCGLAHPALRFALEAVWCWQALAMRGLRDESRNVYRALTGGTLEQAASRIARFDRGILVQSTAKLADDFDYDGIQALSRTHAQRFAALARQMRLLCTRTLPLSAGPCLVCRRCTCPDRPCRYPSRRISAMEAYGLLVSDVCVRSGLAYNYGPGTMTYTSCILYSEE